MPLLAGQDPFAGLSSDSEEEVSEDGSSADAAPNVIIVPSRGAASKDYEWLATQLSKRGVEDVRLEVWPDSTLAREGIWLSFLLCDLGCDKDSTVVAFGPCGAAVALRAAELSPLSGLVLVLTKSSDDLARATTGFFSRPFNWVRIQEHCGFLVQLGGSPALAEQLHAPFRPGFSRREILESVARELSGKAVCAPTQVAWRPLCDTTLSDGTTGPTIIVPGPDELGRVVCERGVGVLRGAVDEELCAACCAQVWSKLDAALETEDEQEFDRLFGAIHQRGRRWDLKLGLDGDVKAVASAAAQVCSTALQAAFAAAAGNSKSSIRCVESAPIAELSCVTSDGGARAQIVHSDSEALNSHGDTVDCYLLTMFVALTDVRMETGPTLVFPDTHTPEFHARAAANPRVLREDAPGLHLCPLGRGDVVLFDSRIFHAGGANISAQRRSLLVLSVELGGGSGDKALGSTYSLLPELRGTTLGMLRR